MIARGEKHCGRAVSRGVSVTLVIICRPSSSSAYCNLYPDRGDKRVLRRDRRTCVLNGEDRYGKRSPPPPPPPEGNWSRSSVLFFFPRTRASLSLSSWLMARTKFLLRFTHARPQGLIKRWQSWSLCFRPVRVGVVPTPRFRVASLIPPTFGSYEKKNPVNGFFF